MAIQPAWHAGAPVHFTESARCTCEIVVVKPDCDCIGGYDSLGAFAASAAHLLNTRNYFVIEDLNVQRKLRFLRILQALIIQRDRIVFTTARV